MLIFRTLSGLMANEAQSLRVRLFSKHSKRVERDIAQGGEVIRLHTNMAW